MASIIAPWMIGRFGIRAGRMTAWIVLILVTILTGVLLYLAAVRLLHPGCVTDAQEGDYCPPAAATSLTLLGAPCITALSALLKLRTTGILRLDG